MPTKLLRVLRPLTLRPLLGLVLCATLLPLLNILFGLAAQDRVPFFMDSIFTAVAAALWGPWQGVATAVITNGMQEVLFGFTGNNLPFAICGVATALIVAAFVRTGHYRSLLGSILCIALVTLANSLLGALIATFLFGGGTRSNIDEIVAAFALFTNTVFTAAFLARIPINFIDKAVAVVPSFILANALARPLGPKSSGAA
jgi:energy-coupling factor transport system substrate-specific component